MAVVELRPAQRTKEFHEAVAGLVADGRTTRRGAPKNPLQLGATFWHFRHESRVTSPSHRDTERHAPAVMGASENFPRAPLLRPLGQPDYRTGQSVITCVVELKGPFMLSVSQP